MQELRLDWNKLGNAGAVDLASCIHNIEVLSVPFCNIDDAGVEALAQSIRNRYLEVKCCVICHLSVSSQKLRNLHTICMPGGTLLIRFFSFVWAKSRSKNAPLYGLRCGIFEPEVFS